MRLCRLTGVEPSTLLHPLDFLSGEDVPSLAFFPGMQMPLAEKLERAEHCIERLQALFQVCSLGEHAQAVTARPALRALQPHFPG